jgi:MEMO1 family protein
MDYPKLRPVEAFPVEQDGQNLLVIHDPSRLAAGHLAVSEPVIFVLSQMDGQHSLETIRTSFAEQFGQPLPEAELLSMVEQLDTAGYLDSDAFAARMRGLVDAYRAAPARVSGGPESFGAEDGKVGPLLACMLAQCQACVTGSQRRLAGLIAPHLDYERGTPCYADAYGTLAVAQPARRFVILGTNHYGRSCTVVGTRKDFQTPLGITPTDHAFLSALEASCGIDLCEHEFDHQQEHSIELQVLLLQHLFGPEAFSIVPLLCPDPCGPTGTAPYDGNGVDLGVFGRALGEQIRADDVPTVIIAGADLSHVGKRFGDDRDLDETFLREVEGIDRAALAALETADAEAFRSSLAQHDNRTRVCSAGSIYTLLTALPNAERQLIRYHQAVDAESGTCVTCSAAALWE